MLKSIRPVVAAAILGLAGAAQAAPTIAAGDSTIYFNNFETQFRSADACAAVAGSCLAANGQEPTGYLRVNPYVANNVFVGDLFIGILNVQNIQSIVSGSDTYKSAVGNEFTGYFVQQVYAINQTDPTAARITLGTAADPFGILAAGEMFRLYANMTGPFSSAGTIASSMASAIDPTKLWASMGLTSGCGMICGGTDGYAYSIADLTATAFTSSVESFYALDLMTLGPLYSAGTLGKLNDLNENTIGGSGSPAQLCSAAQIADPALSCTDVVGTAEIEGNSAFASNNSPWMYASNDPLDLHRQVPEPTSLALLGLALAGIGLARRRKA